MNRPLNNLYLIRDETDDQLAPQEQKRKEVVSRNLKHSTQQFDLSFQDHETSSPSVLAF